MQMINNQLVHTDGFILPTCAKENEADQNLSLKTASDCEAIVNKLVTKVYLNRSSARKPATISLATLLLSSIANELYLNSALVQKILSDQVFCDYDV